MPSDLAPSTEAPTTPAPSDGEQEFASFDFDGLFGASQEEPAAEALPQEPAAADTPSVEAPPAQQLGDGGAPSSQPPQPAVVDDATTEMRRRLDELAQENARTQGILTGMTRAAPQAQQQEQQAEKTPQIYNFGIDDGALRAIRSEDPNEARATLGLIFNQMAHTIHQNAVAHALHLVQRIVPQQLQSQNASAEIQRDFYSAYPKLNHPSIQPMVYRKAQELVRTGRFSTWGPELRDAVAKGVVEDLRNIFGKRAAGPAGGTPPKTASSAGAPRTAGAAPTLPVNMNSPEAIAELFH